MVVFFIFFLSILLRHGKHFLCVFTSNVVFTKPNRNDSVLEHTVPVGESYFIHIQNMKYIPLIMEQFTQNKLCHYLLTFTSKLRFSYIFHCAILCPYERGLGDAGPKHFYHLFSAFQNPPLRAHLVNMFQTSQSAFSPDQSIEWPGLKAP